MAALLVFLKHLELAMRLHAAVPTLDMADAFAHATAAYEAATPKVRPELLLAVAFIESRFDPTATSRVVEGHRHTGRYPSTEPPDGLNAKASLYCGPLQTYAGSWSECMSQRNLPTAYAAAVVELETWLRDRRVHGDIVRALAGHGCGNHGVLTGQCNAYPERVLGIQRRFEPPRRRAPDPALVARS